MNKIETHIIIMEGSEYNVNYADDGELLKYGLKKSWVGGVRLAAAWGKNELLRILLYIPYENRATGRSCWQSRRRRRNGDTRTCSCDDCKFILIHKDIDASPACSYGQRARGSLLNAIAWTGHQGNTTGLRLLLEAGASREALYQLKREGKMHKRARTYMYILSGALSRARAARSGLRRLGSGHRGIHMNIAGFL